MKSINIQIAHIDEAVDVILDLFKKYYKKDDSDLVIQNSIYKVFEEFIDDLWVLIEYPYVDRMYRDSYYTYFSSKHQHYYRDCFRLSFYSEEIFIDDFRKDEPTKKLQELFLGYLVIRPTFSKPIGRSLLSKLIFKEQSFDICTCKGNVLVNGVKLFVEGFPHCAKDNESIMCAETTIWSIMEYFGSRYPDYKPTFPSEIINVLNKFSKQRLLPSNGLTVDQISYALKEFGFGSFIYSRDDAYFDEIKNIVAYYVESGIPLIVSLGNGYINHAIVIIGRDVDMKVNFSKVKRSYIKHGEEKLLYYDYTDIPRKYVVIDDNLPPYKRMSLSQPDEHYSEKREYENAQIESVIVPLYKKIYLDVAKVKPLVIEILKDQTFGYSFNSGFVFRLYLTSSRSFKEHIGKQFSMDETLKDLLILTTMPKFIWVSEVMYKPDIQTDKVRALVVLDATEASEVYIDALVFASYPDRTVSKDEKGFVTLQNKLKGYNRFKNNLK